MVELPDEIWTDILDYLEPRDIVSTQRVSSRLLKVARDSRLWRYKCYEKAPSVSRSFSNRENALSALTGALGGLSLDGRTTLSAEARSQASSGQAWLSRRSKAVAEWDCTDSKEQIDWYAEYVGRHAPFSVVWTESKPNTPEVRGMALFNDGDKVIGPLDDGSLCIWDVNRPLNRRPHLHENATSKPRMLFQDLSASPESSLSSHERTLGNAIDNIAIDSYRNRAYVAAENFVNDVDLETMSLVSQSRYAWPVTALSQNGENQEFSLTVGTSWSLHVHDSRTSSGGPNSHGDVTLRVDGQNDDSPIAFLPNYTKMERRYGDSVVVREVGAPGLFQGIPTGYHRAYARVEPGPQAISHRELNEIIIAGRMPSILFYDRRFFPRLKSSIHSGARLSSIATLPFAPTHSTSEAEEQHTLLACGEYKGRGSLEIYGLSSNPNAGWQPSTGSLPTADAKRDALNTPASTGPAQGGFTMRNRQDAAASKLLCCCIHGARILVSDANGWLRWFERDGRGLARRWNINAASQGYMLPANSRPDDLAPIGTIGNTSQADVVRKMAVLPDARARQPMPVSTATRGDDDILIWTGEKLGIVTCRTQWDESYSHEDLVNAFESKMDLNGSGSSDDEDQAKEAEYAIQMRRALERQADERRWMSRLGGRWR